MIDPPETRYAKSGDLTIAYSVFGEGPYDLVFVPGFISHQELAWDLPLFRGIYERLGAFARVITFDKRGTGLSERTLGFGSAEERMDDIRVVMDAAGCGRAALVGVSEGGPLAALFAATYPERVAGLVLWGTYARIMQAPDYEIGLEPGGAEAVNAKLRDRWGSGKALRFFVHRAPEDPDTDRIIARYERNSSTPSMVVEIMRKNVEIDVRSALPAVSAPTLVVHREDDRMVPRPMGQYLAEHITGARLEVLPGDFHLNGSVGGEEDALDVIEEFLTGDRPARSRAVDRVLATVLFTDIAGSTEHAAAVGDQRWREVLAQFRAAARKELEQYRGREVNTRGDDFFATFDGPARAIRCALAIARAARPLGLGVHSGLHTGEVELLGDDDVAGLAVHIGARLGSLAEAGEILVTSTVRDLVFGSGIEFADRGRHELKGVPGEWQVLAVQE